MDLWFLPCGLFQGGLVWSRSPGKEGPHLRVCVCVFTASPQHFPQGSSLCGDSGGRQSHTVTKPQPQRRLGLF